MNMFDSHGVKREASQRHLQKLLNAISAFEAETGKTVSELLG